MKQLVNNLFEQKQMIKKRQNDEGFPNMHKNYIGNYPKLQNY